MTIYLHLEHVNKIVLYCFYSLIPISSEPTPTRIHVKSKYIYFTVLKVSVKTERDSEWSKAKEFCGCRVDLPLELCGCFFEKEAVQGGFRELWSGEGTLISSDVYVEKELCLYLTFLCFVLNFQALKIDSKCVKALYRRAQAKQGLYEYEAALKDLRKAYCLSRNDKMIHREICSLRKLMMDYLTMEKIRCEKMFK